MESSTDHRLGSSRSVARGKVCAAVTAGVFNVFEIIKQVWDASQTEEQAYNSGPQTGNRGDK
jgi:hypothetical protein